MKKIILSLTIVILFASCSLLKFSINTGDTPLSSTDINTRILVRGFYNEFVEKITTAADSISKSSADTRIKLDAIKWKIDASSLCASAALNSVPEVSLVNTWVLCAQMNASMTYTVDSLLFGEHSKIARTASKDLLDKIDILSKKLLSATKYSQMSEFVAQSTNKKTSGDMILPWINFIGVSDTSYIKTTGTMAQSISDMNEKFSAYSSQYANVFSWSKDIITMKFENDSLQSNIKLQLDSISSSFSRISLVMENSPEIAENIAQKLNSQISQLMRTLDRSVNSAFENISNQRIELQEFVDEQRSLLMAETQTAASIAIDTFMAELPSVLGKIITYVILGLIVLLSIPFAVGYYLGKLKQAKKQDKVS